MNILNLILDKFMSYNYINSHLKFKKQADELNNMPAEFLTPALKKNAALARTKSIGYWNKLKPQQQREVAEKFLGGHHGS